MAHFKIFVNAKKLLNVRFVGRHFIWCVYGSRLMAWGDMAKFPACHPQPHVPIEASGKRPI